MPKISETYPMGEVSQLTVEQLARMLADMYKDLAIAINRRPELIERTTDGQISDTVYSNGTMNINKSTNKVEMITNHPTPQTVTWTQLS